MTVAYATSLETRFGQVRIVADADEAVLALGFGCTEEELRSRVAPSLRPHALQTRPDLGGITKAVTRYDAGEIDALGAVPVRQHGGEFLQRAWAQMHAIPAGQTVSYTELAGRAGAPTAVRAAASACSRNAPALFLPCHRVLRSDGSMGGYRWGTDIKRLLLEWEAQHAASTSSGARQALTPSGSDSLT